MIQGNFLDIIVETAVYNACYINRQHKPVLLRPLIFLKKIDVYESIPKELAEMTWSCRRPIYKGNTYEICGKCHACKSREEIKKHYSRKKL
ncbi:MAG: 7-cyano-7-deazaguanine synthase [Candidatus Hodarchaeota archaeon]